MVRSAVAKLLVCWVKRDGSGLVLCERKVMLSSNGAESLCDFSRADMIIILVTMGNERDILISYLIRIGLLSEDYTILYESNGRV